MLFNSVIAAAILAYTASAAPANTTTEYKPTSTSTYAPPPPATPAPAPGGLSLTQQLFIADTAVDRFALIPNDKDFVFNFQDPTKPGGDGIGGKLVAANRKTFPPLVSTGSGMAVGFLGPCGFNTPHVHPRATELQIVVEGRLTVEMLPENGVFRNNNKDEGRRVITNTVNAFEMTPFYQGSVHTQFNPDCYNTTFIASFNNEDFGAGQIPEELFGFSNDVIAAAFGQAIDGADIDKFREAIPPTIALGVEQCLHTCGIKKR